MKGVRWPKFDAYRHSERCLRRILFLSRADAARGPMAAALLREMSAGFVGADSAGKEPAPALDPLTHAVMGELGLSLAAQAPKPTTAVAGVGYDAVITLCRESWGEGAHWAGSPTVEWFHEDPSLTPDDGGRRLRAFREVRDGLARRIARLLDLPLESLGGEALADMIRRLPD